MYIKNNLLKKIMIINYQCLKKIFLDFSIPNERQEGSGITFLIGDNGTGKTSVLNALNLVSGSLPRDFPDNTFQHFPDWQDKPLIKLDLVNNHLNFFAIDENAEDIGMVFPIIEPSKICNIAYVSMQHKKTYSSIEETVTFYHNKRHIMYKPFLKYKNKRFPDKSIIAQTLENNPEFEDFLSDLFEEKIKLSVQIYEKLPGFYRSGQDNYPSILINGYDKLSNAQENLLYIGCGLFIQKLYKCPLLIDEPESSLHPRTKTKLMKAIMENSKDNQIIISTHCPYFIDFEAICNGAKLHRLYKKEGVICAGSLNDEDRETIRNFSNNINNPHILGLDAKSALFDNKPILVEGQEDVQIYPKIAKHLHKKFKGTFYGWGAGGAGNFSKLCKIFSNLGYSKL